MEKALNQDNKELEVHKYKNEIINLVCENGVI